MKNICPRCKTNELHPKEVYNSLSRKDNKTYICNICGTKEALEEYLAFEAEEAKK